MTIIAFAQSLGKCLSSGYGTCMATKKKTSAPKTKKAAAKKTAVKKASPKKAAKKPATLGAIDRSLPLVL